jgi:hypothetical protein
MNLIFKGDKGKQQIFPNHDFDDQNKENGQIEVSTYVILDIE